MSWLLDTNIVSEMVKKEPNRNVVAWIDSKNDSDLYLSVITIAEIKRGITRLAESNRRSILQEFLDGLLEIYQNNIIPIDIHVAQEWGIISASAEAKGRKISVTDGFIAATSQIHRLTLVTRNVSDFEVTDIPMLNPWV